MLFELLPYPMHIVITFLKPSKFYITSKNQRPVRSTSGKVGGARLRPFMVIALSKCKKKLRGREALVDDAPHPHIVGQITETFFQIVIQAPTFA